MSRSASERRQAFLSIQTFIGLFALGIWVLVGYWILEEDLVVSITKTLPYFLFYELGVFSRYLPGLKEAARNVDGWATARRRV